MSDDFERIEVITGVARRRRWTAEEKLRIVDESFQPGLSVSYVARRHGVAANLLFRWRKLMREGGGEAVRSDGPVVSDTEVRRLEDRVRGLERLLGRKTIAGQRAWRSDLRRNAASRPRRGSGDSQGGVGQDAGKKTELAHALVADGKFAMKTVADMLQVARSNLAERAARNRRCRGAYRKADDPELIAAIRGLVDERPTYGYRRITALLKRRSEDLPRVNHKRIYRIMRLHGLLLQRHSGRRPGRVHDGKVVVMRSNLRPPQPSGCVHFMNRIKGLLAFDGARTYSRSPAGTARSFASVSCSMPMIAKPLAGSPSTASVEVTSAI